MKNVLFISLLLSVATVAFAQTSDRVRLEGGSYGVTHTENFGIVCKMKPGVNHDNPYSIARLHPKIYVKEGQKIRVAYGLTKGIATQLSRGLTKPVVGLDMKVFSVQRLRCPGCYDITVGVQGDKDPLHKILLRRNQVSIGVLLADGQVVPDSTGTCERNEVH